MFFCCFFRSKYTEGAGVLSVDKFLDKDEAARARDILANLPDPVWKPDDVEEEIVTAPEQVQDRVIEFELDPEGTLTAEEISPTGGTTSEPAIASTFNPTSDPLYTVESTFSFEDETGDILAKDVPIQGRMYTSKMTLPDVPEDCTDGVYHVSNPKNQATWIITLAAAYKHLINSDNLGKNNTVT